MWSTKSAVQRRTSRDGGQRAAHSVPVRPVPVAARRCPRQVQADSRPSRPRLPPAHVRVRPLRLIRSRLASGGFGFFPPRRLETAASMAARVQGRGAPLRAVYTAVPTMPTAMGRGALAAPAAATIAAFSSATPPSTVSAAQTEQIEAKRAEALRRKEATELRDKQLAQREQMPPPRPPQQPPQPQPQQQQRQQQQQQQPQQPQQPKQPATALPVYRQPLGACNYQGAHHGADHAHVLRLDKQLAASHEENLRLRQNLVAADNALRQEQRAHASTTALLRDAELRLAAAAVPECAAVQDPSAGAGGSASANGGAAAGGGAGAGDDEEDEEEPSVQHEQDVAPTFTDSLHEHADFDCTPLPYLLPGHYLRAGRTQRYHMCPYMGAVAAHALCAHSLLGFLPLSSLARPSCRVAVIRSMLW